MELCFGCGKHFKIDDEILMIERNVGTMVKSSVRRGYTCNNIDCIISAMGYDE
jgi:hypothetical protein